MLIYEEAGSWQKILRSASVPQIGRTANMPRLTDGFVSKLRVPEGQREVRVFDSELPGFGIAKFQTGRSSFFVKYSIGKKQRKMTLGAAIPGVAAEMRRKASDILARARIGQDTAGEAKIAKTRKITVVGDLIEKFLDDRQGALRTSTLTETRRYLHKHFADLHPLAIDGVTRKDVVRVVDDIMEARGRVAADRSRAALSSFFGWCVDRGYRDENPTLGIRARSSNGARKRVLNDGELTALWQASGAGDYGAILKLLILTGQRKVEIADLSWNEIDLEKRHVLLPAHRVKNGREHLVPLSQPALDILQALPRQLGRDLVFGSASGGFSGWSRAKAALDERLKGKVIEPWVLHDIRRSVASGMGSLGIDLHITEKVLNHQSGSFAGIVSVYQRYSFDLQKREALEKWAAHVAALVAP
jgi:integrase